MNLMKTIAKQELSIDMNRQIEQTIGEMSAYISIRPDETTFMSNKNKTWSKDLLEQVDVHRVQHNTYSHVAKDVQEQAERVREMNSKKQTYPQMDMEMSKNLVDKQ